MRLAFFDLRLTQRFFHTPEPEKTEMLLVWKQLHRQPIVGDVSLALSEVLSRETDCIAEL